MYIYVQKCKKTWGKSALSLSKAGETGPGFPDLPGEAHPKTPQHRIQAGLKLFLLNCELSRNLGGGSDVTPQWGHISVGSPEVAHPLGWV